MSNLLLQAALTPGARVEILIAAGAILWLGFAAMTAGYGREQGYPFVPLFIAAVFLGFPLVLLVVAIAAGPQTPRQ